jgi:transposase
MRKNYFTDEQVQQLNMNPYVKKASNKYITYTDDFKITFTKKYLEGNPPSVILREMGFNPRILGKKRIDRFVGNIYKYKARGDDFSDQRGVNSGRPSLKEELTDKERIARLEHKIKYLKQENEFLKKIEFIDKKAELETQQKLHRKRSSKSSEK